MSTQTRFYVTIAVMAGLSALLSLSNHFEWWQRALIVFPTVFWLYLSHRLSLARLESEKRHVEDMADLHLRTIEALALAIEAEDYTKPGHIRRVEVYSVEIGRELRLNDSELKALRAAALLHDIGKLAVPEHILSKPGQLSAVEFEKMKIHPSMGAEILEQVEFPYPVAPIVRAHHEKWDGTGYPLGLRGEEIPIGARILAAVDCLDALSSDRRYRRAIPPGDAMQHLVSEAGKSFDPQVVDVLVRRHREFAKIAQTQPERELRQPEQILAATGPEQRDQPVTGARHGVAKAPVDFLSSIAAARQEVQDLFELMHDLGSSLSLDETLSVLAMRLRRMCPYDCVAVYVRRGDTLIPEYANGENFQLFSSLEIPMGEGLSGWVAMNREPIVNGNPSVEAGYLNDPGKFSTLKSALAVPLEGLDGVVGVLTLYHADKDAFTQDHLRILQALTHKVAISIENALRYRRAETCAVTDALTGLPNARSLFLHLDSELARCKREKSPLSVLVCDLDGFKRVNDRFGHLEGNKLLRKVAEGLRENCREYDYVARMGGDEFVIVLPGRLEGTVGAKAQFLSEVASKVGWLHCGENVLSMSVGQAMFPADGSDAEQLLVEADRRMYQAKNEQNRAGKEGTVDGPPEVAMPRGLALVS